MAQLRSMLRRHAWLLILSALYVIIGMAAIDVSGHPTELGVIEVAYAWLGSLFGLMLGLVIGNAVWTVAVLRPAFPLRVVTRRIRTQLDRRVLVETLPVVFVLGPVSIVFAELKSRIPALVPFHWDVDFARIDAWLHGGIHPWEWLAGPFLNGPVLTILTLLYAYGWHAIGFTVLAHACFIETSIRLRMRFLLSFFACWMLLGSVAAVAFSSAGPAYYALLHGPPGDFGPLLEQLRMLDRAGWLTPVPIIDLLWRAYQPPGVAPWGLGISAMPSLHVAISCLYFLYARHYGGVAAVLAAFYLGVTLVGSVISGWHYAVDGYAAILGTIAIWWLAGRVTDADPALRPD